MKRESDASTATPSPSGRDTLAARFKWVGLALFVAGVGWVFYQYRDALSLDRLAEHEDLLRSYQDAWYVLLVAFALYVGVTAVSLPGAVPLTLTYAWYFGFWKALVLVSFASTAGATLAFLLSRYFFREAMLHRFGDRLETFNQRLEVEGPFYLFTLRLIPLVPFFVINLVMGLTPIKTRTYWWVSQLGMLPGTAVYAYAGYSVPSLRELAAQGAQGILTVEILVAFVLLGTFPFVVKRLVAMLRKRVVQPS